MSALRILSTLSTERAACDNPGSYSVCVHGFVQLHRDVSIVSDKRHKVHLLELSEAEPCYVRPRNVVV